MNRNIEKIANSVGVYFKPMVVDGVEYSYNHVQLSEYKADSSDEKDVINKFAQAIIEECLAVVNKSEKRYGKEGMKEKEEAAKEIAKLIIKKLM